MAAKKGKLFLLKVGSDTVLTSRNVSFTINNEQVDTTTAGEGWVQLLEGAGIQSFSADISGLYKDQTYEATINGYAVANSINTFSIVNEDGDDWTGTFAIANYGRSGTHNGAEEYSFTLNSSGAVVYTAAV